MTGDAVVGLETWETFVSGFSDSQMLAGNWLEDCGHLGVHVCS